MTRSSTVTSVGALTVLAAGALAGPLAYEGFQYLPVPLPGLNGCCGWGGPWVGSLQMMITPPTLSSPLALPSTGNAVWNHGIGEAWRPFLAAGPATNIGNELWISFMEESQLPGTTAFVSLDSSNVSLPSIYINKDFGGSIVLTSAGLSTGPGVFSKGSGLVDFFVIHLTQFSGGLTNVEFWVNPTVWPTPPLPPVGGSLPSMGLSYSLGRFYWRADDLQILDEIRIGTTLADVMAGQGGGCYANCDASTTSPCLNVQDFACFLNRFAAGDTRANCDGSTTSPLLNVLDFSCFLNRYAAGCSSC